MRLVFVCYTPLDLITMISGLYHGEDMRKRMSRVRDVSVYSSKED